MSIRPKTKRRVVYLVVGAVLALGLVAGGYRLRMAYYNKIIYQARADGMAAYKAGDYPAAIEKLNIYVIKHRDDPEALMAFGIARSKVPSPDNSNVIQAIAIINRYCTLVPRDIEAQHLLLELEAPVAAYTAEALGTAKDLLKQNPNDLTALKAVARINHRERHFDAALDAALKYTQTNPADLDMQRGVMLLMKQLNRPPSELHQRADALAKQYPNDPRFLLVKAMAYYYGTSPTDTSDKRSADLHAYLELLQKAAAQDPPDAQFVTITVSLLDASRQYRASLDLLVRTQSKINDPEVTRLLAQRLWESRKFSQVATLLANLDAASPRINVDLIAYKALSLYSLDKKSEAAALVSALVLRANDPHAAAWAAALQARLDEAHVPLKSLLARYQDALRQDPNNPVIQYYLGEAYWRLDEEDLALQQWRSASARLPSWPEPYVRIAQVLTSQGRGGADEAAIAAEQGLRTSAGGGGTYDLQAVIAQAVVRFARLQNTQDPQEESNLLQYVQTVQEKLPGEPATLPIYAVLLVQAGQRDKAIDIIKDAQKNPQQSGEDLLLKLAQVSRQCKLGLEDGLFATLEQQFGLTPRLAYAKATQPLQAGRAADGLQLLRSAKAKAAANALQWDRVICQYREVSNDPAAAQAWQALGDAYPNDLAVQSTILFDEDSAWSNREFIDRTINRLKDLTGDEATSWKTARARWLLGSDNPQRDAPAAVVLLTDVLKTSPGEAAPHVLMAIAYEKLQNDSAAVAEWRQAADIAPSSPKFLFGLLHALDAAGQTDDARQTFDRIAALPHLPPDLALQASILIASEGDPRRAQALLLAYPVANDQILHDATLAKVDRLLGKVNDAATLYFNLGQAPSLDPATIEAAADFFGSQHDPDAAKKFLARLDSLTLAPGQRELILANFEEKYGDPAAAAQLYADAVKSAADRPNAAIQQIGFFLRQRQLPAATSALGAAIARWPDNAALANLKSAIAALAGPPQLAEQMWPLAFTLTRNPLDPAASDTLAILAASSSEDPASTLKKLQGLIGKYPRFLPLYELTVQRLQAQQRFNDAVAMASSAMTQFSESPDAARLCAQTYARVGRWNDVILAANQWRQRGATQPLLPDLLIATADLFLDQPRDAVDRLSIYIPDAKSNPDQNQQLLATYAEALIRSGSETDAIALLRPLAEKSAQWRSIWLKVAAAAHADAPSTVAAIQQILPLLDSHALQDQQALADAYLVCAARWNYSNGFQLARDALQGFVDSPDVTVPALMTYALACGGAGDNVVAEKAYRHLLSLDSKQPIAQNNLADILRKKDDPASLKEAEGLARAAVAANPNNPDTANFYDTLARILLKQNRTNDALAAFMAGDQLQPKNLNILIGEAWVCATTSRIDDASNYLARIDAVLPPGARLLDEYQSQLDTARKLVKAATAPKTEPDISPAATRP